MYYVEKELNQSLERLFWDIWKFFSNFARYLESASATPGYVS